MKHSFLLSLIVLLFATSCTDKEAFKVTGSFVTEDFNGKTVYLMDADQVKIDSAKVENKQFKFKGIASDVSNICFIQFSEQYRPSIFFPEPGNIEITIDSSFISNLKGTPLNDTYQNFSSEMFKLVEKFTQMEGVLGKEVEEGKVTPEEAQNKQMDFVSEFVSKRYEFVKQNIKNPIGEYLFLDTYSSMNLEQISELIPMMNPEFRATENVQKAEEMTKSLALTEIGRTFIDVKGKSIDGKDVSLSDYAGKGKIVLVDFWASWCGPCIRTLPDLVATYEKFKNKGFEIVGISLDDNQEKWVNATAIHKISWPQLSNLQGWTDPASQAYGINSIPATILLDKNGVIIEKNLDGETLDLKLSELLK